MVTSALLLDHDSWYHKLRATILLTSSVRYSSPHSYVYPLSCLHYGIGVLQILVHTKSFGFQLLRQCFCSSAMSLESPKTSLSDKLRQVAASSTDLDTWAIEYRLSSPSMYWSNSRRKHGEFICASIKWIAFKNRSESKSVTAAASRSCVANFFLLSIALLLRNAIMLLTKYQITFLRELDSASPDAMNTGGSLPVILHRNF